HKTREKPAHLGRLRPVLRPWPHGFPTNSAGQKNGPEKNQVNWITKSGRGGQVFLRPAGERREESESRLPLLDEGPAQPVLVGVAARFRNPRSIQQDSEYVGLARRRLSVPRQVRDTVQRPGLALNLTTSQRIEQPVPQRPFEIPRHGERRTP